ncbi:DUF3040 domain-containing protein [Pseudonocardia xinjiangensis]|uniref:DUF3040 domain-containing protein n=1 Tax=Pseudonocardia xinjiangensis TaxID=75289 RepID=A0ABX1RCU6_9PSEU|nr:DUF3040 domain-containing protein [Pseudonocardia xinjiangensis]NMH77724.1 DUF3040 domain-containing protein [Pseudonocardia xinjiangensis]
MKFVINADTDEILGAPLLRIDAQEIINTVRCRRAARRHAAALCDAIDTHPSPTEAFDSVRRGARHPGSGRRAAGRHRDPRRGSHVHDGAGAGPAAVGGQPMSLDHHDFLQLSRIAESVRRSDPELARTLAAPMGPQRSSWQIIAYVTLFSSAILLATGLAIGAALPAAAGGIVLITIYPFLLIKEKKRSHHRNARSKRNRPGT